MKKTNPVSAIYDQLLAKTAEVPQEHKLTIMDPLKTFCKKNYIYLIDEKGAS